MSDKSSKPITYQPKPVPINGVKYKRRRLGFEDGMKLVNLAAKAMAVAAIDVSDMAELDDMKPSGMVGLLGGAFLHRDTQDEILEFLGSTLQDFPLSVEDMHDPEQFPLGSEAAILVSLMEDEDIAAFFDSARKLWKLRTRLQGTKKSKK